MQSCQAEAEDARAEVKSFEVSDEEHVLNLLIMYQNRLMGKEGFRKSERIRCLKRIQTQTSQCELFKTSLNIFGICRDIFPSFL